MTQESNITRPLCFVIMPFEKIVSVKGNYPNLGKAELDTIYDLFYQILEGLGYEVRRADSVGDILHDIVYSLDRADLVLADLTGLNPNVMYELGIRHGFIKKTLLATQDITELPFDLKNYFCVQYQWITKRDKEALTEQLKTAIDKINSNPQIKFSPVETHLEAKKLGVFEAEQKLVLRKLKALRSEWATIFGILVNNANTETWNRIPENIDEKSTQEGIEAQFGDAFANLRSALPDSFPATDNLIANCYIPEEYNAYGDIDTFQEAVMMFRHNSIERSNIGIIRCVHLIKALTKDLSTIMEAIANQNVGIALNMQSKPLLENVFFRTAYEEALLALANDNLD